LAPGLTEKTNNGCEQNHNGIVTNGIDGFRHPLISSSPTIKYFLMNCAIQEI
jgi:hypothetical protein